MKEKILIHTIYQGYSETFILQSILSNMCWELWQEPCPSDSWDVVPDFKESKFIYEDKHKDICVFLWADL